MSGLVDRIHQKDTALAIEDDKAGGDSLGRERREVLGPGTANTLSVTEERPAGWSTEPPLGLAYRPGEDRVPGLVTIHRQRCIATCTEDPVYAFSVQMTWSTALWEREEEAFSCFDPEHAPEGTEPIIRLRNPDTYARTWALRGSAYHEEAVAQGFEETDNGEPLCYVWPPDGAASG